MLRCTAILPKLSNLQELCFRSSEPVDISIPTSLNIQKLDIAGKANIKLLPRNVKELSISNCNLTLDEDLVPSSISKLHTHILLGSDEAIKSLIEKNKHTLQSLEVFRLDDDMVDLVPEIVNMSNLNAFAMNTALDLQLIQDRSFNFLEFNSCLNFDIMINLTELKLEHMTLYPETGVFMNSHLKVLSIWEVTLDRLENISFCNLLQELHLKSLKTDNLDYIDGTILQIPPNIKRLTINRFYLTKIGPIPESIEELDLKDNSLEAIGPFDNHKNLHTINLNYNRLESAILNAENLKNLSLTYSFQNVKQLTLNDSLENLTVNTYIPIGFENITNWNNLNSLKSLSLRNHELGYKIDNVHFPASLEKVEILFNSITNVQFDSVYLKELILHVEEPSGTFMSNFHFPPTKLLSIFVLDEKQTYRAQDFAFLQNCQVEELQLCCKIETTAGSPLLLPSSLEILQIENFAGKEVHLEFPRNRNTNLKEFHMCSSNPFSEVQIPEFSYYSIGHGKNNTYHNNLERIECDIPPVFTSDLNKKVTEIINNGEIDWKTYEWDRNLLREIFEEPGTPPSLSVIGRRKNTLWHDSWRLSHPRFREAYRRIYEK